MMNSVSIKLRSAVADLQQRLRSPRVRSEIGWVLAHRLAQVIIMFASLKVLTSLLSQSEFGVFKLAENLLLLLAFGLTDPILQAQRRYFHAAKDEPALATSLAYSFRCHVILVGFVVLMAVVGQRWLAEWLEVTPSLLVLAAVLFVFNRIRNFGLSLLDVERLRKQCAQQHIGFEVIVIIAVGVVLWFVADRYRSAGTVMAVYVGVAAPFAVLSMRRYWPKVRAGWGKMNPEFRSLLITFGLPSLALQSFQWLLGFADRFIVADEAGQAAAGFYIGVRQVCSAPFSLAVQASTMLMGVAYQQIGDQSDPVRVWYAYRTLLLGVLLYGCFGIVAIIGYLMVGPELVVLLTGESYRSDRLFVVLLAIGQYLLSFGFVLQIFYFASTKLNLLIAVRVVMGVVGVGIYWWLIRQYGMIGGAYGSIIAGALSIMGLLFIPGGITSIVLQARQAKNAVRADSLSDNE